MKTVNDKTLEITEYRLLGELPDPFILDSGERVTSPVQWGVRRKELYGPCVELQYGCMPPEPEFLEVETLYRADTCSYMIHTGTRLRPIRFRMQVVLPAYPWDIKEKVPAIVDGDLSFGYYFDKAFMRAALDRNIAWVFFDRTELAHDICGEGRGKGQLCETYPECRAGALAAWAWGYSRCVDALEKIDLPIDLDWIVFTGHSRGGKTVALAGAVDERARIVNPNETCAGACGCYRVHMKGKCEGAPEGRSETLKDIWGVFPFWFGERFGDYADDETKLPFDAHFLKAMVAPRTLFVSEAAGDIWANPVGSWQTTEAAREVFDFLGAKDRLYWYFRPGTHGHLPEDVEMLVNVILHEKDNAPVDRRMYRLPFEAPPKAYSWEKP